MKAEADYNGDIPFYAQQKALNVSSGLSALFDAWQFMAVVLPAPFGPLLRNVQIRSRRICPTQFVSGCPCSSRTPDNRQNKKPHA
ncbi:hypothetical protein, partial [Serratia sp. X3]|uniref:hypothetical protein n=1 Tax=Serratia sp. X3 TaxID=2780495 RepID=UPI001D0BE765